MSFTVEEDYMSLRGKLQVFEFANCSCQFCLLNIVVSPLVYSLTACCCGVLTEVEFCVALHQAPFM